MKTTSLARSLRLVPTLVVLAAALGAMPGGSEAADLDPAGFVPLFNGTDFTGWRFGDESAVPERIPAAWSVADGVIVGTGDPAAILASQWDYGEFEFEFEWKAGSEEVDADLYVHAGRLLEADPIRITSRLAGGPQETDRGEGLHNASATGSIGGGGSARKPVPGLQKLIGEWNTWRIVADGPKFMLFCNGQEAWSCVDHVPRKGCIGFRVFQGPLEVRNPRTANGRSVSDEGGRSRVSRCRRHRTAGPCPVEGSAGSRHSRQATRVKV